MDARVSIEGLEEGARPGQQNDAFLLRQERREHLEAQYLGTIGFSTYFKDI